MNDETASDSDRLDRIGRELKTIRELINKVIFAINDAESEIPERMRRFIMYMHDMHDVKNLYDEHGLACPAWVLREVERCDDRLRQILTEYHTDGGVFEKVRREMAKDPLNRWDHTRQLSKPKETGDETRPSDKLNGGINEGGA